MTGATSMLMRMGTWNTATSYGSFARILHWVTALVVFAAIALGLSANGWPSDADADLLAKFRLFSFHKTVGLTALGLGLLRLASVARQEKPSPVSPQKRLENFLAATVHAMLLIALVLVPVTGWLAHSATEGLAPILWPFGQSLPFVPVNPDLAERLATVHVVTVWSLIAVLSLHVAGALKHAVIDRDGVFARMVSGRAAGTGGSSEPRSPAWLAGGLWGVALAAAVGAATVRPAPPPLPEEWPVTEAHATIRNTLTGSLIASTDAVAMLLDLPANPGGPGTLDITLPLDALQGPGAEEFLSDAVFPLIQFSGTVTGDGNNLEAGGTLDSGFETVAMTITIEVGAETARIEGVAPWPGDDKFTVSFEATARRP